MKQTRSTRPVVLATVSEPVAIGLAQSLGRPGGNFTGLTTMNRELMPKRLQLLQQAIPGLARVGYLANPGYETHKLQLTEMTNAARHLGMTLHLAEARSVPEIDAAFASMETAKVGAFIVQQDDLFNGNRMPILEAAAKRRLAGMFVFSTFARAGGLMSYGPDPIDLYRRAATYVDKILKGTKPLDLPIEQPTIFQFDLNLKSAKALGITIPQIVLLQATELIE